jgi:hypothetical protein
VRPLVGPRAAGKTTTALQRAASVIRLDVPGEALAFRADPDAIIRGASEPVLLDEWQAVTETFPAVIDRMARGESIATPGERLDIRDYLDLALRSGFPEALSISSAPARQLA